MGITVTVASKHQAKSRIRNIQKRANNPDPGWRRVGAYISREVNRQFRTRGGNFGTPWAPLAASTIKQKRAAGYPRQPLVRSGDLKREFTGRPLDVEVYSGKTAKFGSNSQLAVWQQRGTRRGGKRHIPPRPILVGTPKLHRDVRDIMAKYIVGRTRKKLT